MEVYNGLTKHNFSTADTKFHTWKLTGFTCTTFQVHSELMIGHLIRLLGFTKVSVSRGQVTLAISKGGKDFTYFCSFKFVCDDDEMHMLLSCEP